jgi:hypothetical protein
MRNSKSLLLEELETLQDRTSIYTDIILDRPHATETEMKHSN